ncbi:hypothetical protein C8R45DRAFT_1152118 [Mycena sanguinolenta]|nr:hypothetical protein C8R45DRAFT_1152118 [Mycena sanguinolenta]
MSNTQQGADALTDSTNTDVNAKRSRTKKVPAVADAAGKSRSGASTSDEHDQNTSGLQKAIPGAKVVPKQGKNKAKTKPSLDGTTGGNDSINPETMESLLARIAQLEGEVAARNNVDALVQAPDVNARARAQENAPLPRTPAAQRGGCSQQAPAPPTPIVTAPGGPAQNAAQAPMIAKPRKETNIQIGMRLAKTEEGHAMYKAALTTVRDCVTRADMNLALPWDKQPLDKQLLVVNAAKSKLKYLDRMENDWATHMLARQYLKNKRVTAYKRGTIERPNGYDHLKVNATLRSTDGSRVKKAKLILQARLAKRALDNEGDGPADRPPKKARTSNSTHPSRKLQPEFMEGSSRDGRRDPIVNEWDAHPQKDDEGEDEDDPEKYEMDQDMEADESDDGNN